MVYIWEAQEGTACDWGPGPWMEETDSTPIHATDNIPCFLGTKPWRQWYKDK